MFEFLAEKTIQILESLNIISKNRAIYKFRIEILISILVEILLIMMIGFILDCFFEAVIYNVIFLILRRYTGGYHCTTHLGCISTYVAFFGLYVIIKEYFNFSIVVLCINILIIEGSIVYLSPVQPNNKILNELEQKKYHLYSITLSILIGITCLMLKLLDIQLYTILIYSFSLVAVFMIGEKVIDKFDLLN
ncbi:MAG: accessory gene regulator B family protein [Thomasclavelia sp.]|uniref:accessory gene regulator B family protein n=1 Tax=Thomasclavelia sp. TaxID=3025757 RepID=UPI00399F0825